MEMGTPFKTRTKTIVSVIAIILLYGCNTKESHIASIPEPNYSDTTQWYHQERNAEADIFYIISTEVCDYTNAEGDTSHFADTYNDSIRQLMNSEMTGVDYLLSGDLNFYSPYYRQCTLESFTDEELQKERLRLATNDVKKAFLYYLQNENKGRPFVLMGFSQGAMIAIELLKTMDENTYNRMIAAYIIGASVDEGSVGRKNHIIAAHDSTDTGVTICYNSVRDTSCTIFKRSSVFINPVNWHTDTTSATLLTVPSPFKSEEEQQTDTLKINLDPESGLLIVNGFSDDNYITPLIGKEGNYHSREIWLYRQPLKDNIALRTHTFLNKIGQNK